MQIFPQFTDELETLWSQAASKTTPVYPFFSYAWHRGWYTHFGQKESLTIAADRDLKTIIPLAIDEHTAHFTGGEEIADYLDAIGPEETKAEAWKSVLSLLSARHITRLNLRNIPEASETLRYFRTLPGVSIATEDTTPILTLPESFDEYLTILPRKERHEVRRKMKRFEQEHTDATIQVAERYDSTLLIALMSNNPDKTSFLTPPMKEFFVDLQTAAGSSIRQATLLVASQPVATTLSFLTDDTLLLYNSGYDPGIIGAGWYLKARLIQWCIDQKIHSLNYLQGNERYKYDFGATDRFVYRIELPI